MSDKFLENDYYYQIASSEFFYRSLDLYSEVPDYYDYSSYIFFF